MQTPELTPKRRRGGQPGNTNRLIHGRFSRRLPRKLTWPDNPRTGHDPDFEIVMARVHLVQLLEAQQRAPTTQWLSYERAVIDCIGLIVSLIAAGNRRRRNRPQLDAILRSLRTDPGGADDSNLIRTAAAGHPIVP